MFEGCFQVHETYYGQEFTFGVNTNIKDQKQPAEINCLIRNIIGIKHGFSLINIRQVPWEVLKTAARGRGF